MGATNYDWLWARFTELNAAADYELTALDFGCGEGSIITRSIAEGVGEFHGADTYYGDREIAVEQKDTEIPESTRACIKRLESGEPLPFPDAAFDFVCSNQVFEHIADLGFTVAELARVTKPTGVHLHVFPTKERIIEGHLGVPLIHRLPEHRRRVWARLFYRRANFATRTESFDEWWTQLGPFLAEHTFYRTSHEYDVAFTSHFEVRHVERAKLAYHLAESRLRRLTPTASRVPRSLELMRAGSAVELTLRPPSATAVGPAADSAVAG